MRTDSRTVGGWGGVFLTLLSLLSGCTSGPAGHTAVQTPFVSVPAVTARPTASSTPAPTVRPTITRLPTPTPKPTWTRIPITKPLAEAVVPEGWPSLPADLYFLRDGRLWRWPAEGGFLEELPLVEDGEKVLDYRLTPEGRYVAYLTSEAGLFVWDRFEGRRTLIPTVGELSTEFDVYWRVTLLPNGNSAMSQDQFDITSDGRYVLYVAWGTQDSAEGTPGATVRPLPAAEELEHYGDPYGVIFAVDVQDPERHFELGFCGAQQVAYAVSYCRGFLLSRDGRYAAVQDGWGLWLFGVPDGEPRLLAEHTFHLKDEVFCGYWQPEEWSLDGQWLLVRNRCWEGGFFTIMEIDSGEVQDLPDTFCYDGCVAEAAWVSQGIWASVVGEWDTLYLGQVTQDGTIGVTRFITESATLYPTDLQPLPDGGVAFAHHACLWDNWSASGVYFLGPDGAVRKFIQLPVPRCCSMYASCGGSLSWAQDGVAFLYLDEEGNPTFLAPSDGSALWDVRKTLKGAYWFEWGPPISGGE